MEPSFTPVAECQSDAQVRGVRVSAGSLEPVWLSSVHWAAVPVHRRRGLQLRSESQAIPGSRSKRLRSWLGVRVCPLPGLSSFVLSFRGKMVARAAM